ncbi:MAG: Uma2 family endonuclease [Pyrinomonadaceae bacterium MAG19_C2-C3]|nr:Uma2 family endonuclease [Pyrinomonadaceae bacterium MAG19_C2-C3]
MAQHLGIENIAPPPVISQQKHRLTFEEFLTLYESIHAEWIDGEVVLMSPPTNKHQKLVGFLYALLQHLAEAHDAGDVFVAPFAMKVNERRGREPDVLFVAKENLDRLKSSHLLGAADIAIEVISPESQTRDRGDKFYEYEQAGVREYWMFDQKRKQAEFYRLNAEGMYQPVLIEDGIFRSEVLTGFWLRIEWLWREPLPTLVSVLREWKLI